jgi:hypothetical protein
MGYSNGISQREKFLRVDFGWMGNSLSLYVTQGWAKIRVCAQRVSDPVAPTGLLYRHYLLKKNIYSIERHFVNIDHRLAR